MSENNSLPIGSSVMFQIEVKNPIESNSAVNNASVSVVLKDPSGNDVTGVNWPYSVPYIAESDGVYRATVEPISGLVEGTVYEAEYTVLGADGIVGKFCKKLRAKGC